MGALTPLLSVGLPLAAQGLGAIAGASAQEAARRQTQESQDLALAQLQARQRLEEAQRAQNAALEREKMALNTAQAEEERKTALRRAVARQRARFGAQGVGSGTGSSQAVLLGMFEESDEERQKREELDTLRLNALDQDLTQKKSLNVLQRTQLEERNKLDDLTSGARGVDNAARFLKAVF